MQVGQGTHQVQEQRNKQHPQHLLAPLWRHGSFGCHGGEKSQVAYSLPAAIFNRQDFCTVKIGNINTCQQGNDGGQLSQLTGPRCADVLSNDGHRLALAVANKLILLGDRSSPRFGCARQTWGPGLSVRAEACLGSLEGGDRSFVADGQISMEGASAWGCHAISVRDGMPYDCRCAGNVTKAPKKCPHFGAKPLGDACFWNGALEQGLTSTIIIVRRARCTRSGTRNAYITRLYTDGLAVIYMAETPACAAAGPCKWACVSRRDAACLRFLSSVSLPPTAHRVKDASCII